jgi:hypothetical protein
MTETARSPCFSSSGDKIQYQTKEKKKKVTRLFRIACSVQRAACSVECGVYVRNNRGTTVLWYYILLYWATPVLPRPLEIQ